MPPSSTSASSPPHRAWSRVRRVFAAHPWISDGLLWALPVTWAGVSAVREMTWLEPRATVPMWVWVAITVLTTAPLALRRVQPLLSSVLIAVACCLALLTGLGPTFAIIAVPLTVFSTASWGTRAHARIVLVLGIVGAFAASSANSAISRPAYRGLVKNGNLLYAMFACANLYMLAIAGRSLCEA